ncbi:MAG TPA: chromate efflux transporter [Solirubrobacteraceae bacterium]|nr:chromate efflux transporter [Solirubrobacteraceae bacterium]
MPLSTVAREWARIGFTGFGGPPAHIALLRALVVERRGWLDAREFQDANAACGLLPGPASTQLSIFCAWRVAGPAGAVVGGLGFIAPAVALVLALSALFLERDPPLWVRGAGAGAGAAVAAVAVRAGVMLLGPSLAAVRGDRARLLRWAAYVGAGTAGAVWLGAWLVLVLAACGIAELIAGGGRPWSVMPLAHAGRMAAAGGLAPLAWTALKVGALSFGGGFVIVPLMQADAIHAYHWMSAGEFLNAVALGQATPGPVVATVAAVGYAAHGVAGGLLAALVAFAPSFAFILLGGGRFDRVRDDRRARAFLDGAGPAAIGAILGAAVTLAGALTQAWQFALLGVAAIWLVLARRGIVQALVGAGAIGVIAALMGAPLGR